MYVYKYTYMYITYKSFFDKNVLKIIVTYRNNEIIVMVASCRHTRHSEPLYLLQSLFLSEDELHI